METRDCGESAHGSARDPLREERRRVHRYQVSGDGAFDVVFVPPSVSNVELRWADERRASYFRRLSSFCRLIVFDKRGTGLSDRVAGIPDLETRMDDVSAVMDAAGWDRAALIGVSEGGPMAALFAATYPERVRALVSYGALPRFTRAPGFPFGWTREEWLRESEADAANWGSLEQARDALGPEASNEDLERFAAEMRQSASPGAARQLGLMNADIDGLKLLLRAVSGATNRTPPGGFLDRLPDSRGGQPGTGVRFARPFAKTHSCG